MSKDIHAIHNHVLFQFKQGGKNVSAGANQSQAFQEKTAWGFEFHDFDESTKEPRWGTVKAIGPNVTDEIKVGMDVLIENLKWTNHVKHGDEKYWRTDDTCILAYRVPDS